MSVPYKNPVSSIVLTDVDSVLLNNTFGTNFSVYNVGGYMEVYTLNDLGYDTYGATGNIQNSGNTIPIQFYKRPVAPITDRVTLWSDAISSGRRRLGMLVYVHETETTYQYVIPNYDTLWDNAVADGCISTGATSFTVSNRVGGVETASGQALIEAWTGSTIEGQNGVTRNNARWRVFWGTDWQITGGTYNSGTGTLSLDNNTGGTINVTGFTTGGSDTYVTGGTYSSGTTTLTLTRNDGNTVDVTGFTSGGGGSLTLQDVTDNGSTTTSAISVRSLTSEFDLTINEGITAGNGGGDISSNTVFGASALANNSTGNGNSAFGTWTLSATTGSGNSAFGSLALYKNTTGNNNTAIGKNAMYNGTNSAESVAVGSGAFYSGGGNTGVAIGYQAGYGVTTASGSILIGYRAGYDITDNSRNIAIGYESLRFNDVGTFNVAIGDTALQGNRSGDFNVGVGNDALVSNTTGLRNVGVGSDSLSQNQTGNDNVALGFEAGQNISGGGLNGTTNDSIFIGKGTKASVTNGSNEIVIGTDAIGNGSNTITLGNTGHTDTYLFGTVHGVPYLTGGSYSNGTLTLEDVDGGSFNITGFSTGSTGSQNLQQVLDNGNVSTTGMFISGATLTASTVDINGGTIDNVALGSTNPVSLVSNSVDINGGTIDNVALGSTNPVSLVSNSVDINGGTIDNVTLGNTNPVILISNSVDINGGAIDNTTIGAQVRSTGAFTYIYDNNGLTGNTGQILSTSTTGITWIDSSSTDYYVTGGTLSAQGELTLTRNDGNSIEITGFTAQESDTYVTGATYTESTGILTLTRNDGNTVGAGGWSYIKSITESNNNLTVTDNAGNASLIGIDAITGLGYNDWGLTGTTSGTLFYLGTELPFITGGTYSNGTITLGINGVIESDITITGIDADDTYLTGATYNPTTLTLGMSDGTDVSVSGFAPEITGGTYNNGTLSLEDNVGGSVDITGITFSSTNIYSNDGQLSANRVVDQNSNSLTFSGGSVSMGTGTTSPVCAILELASTTQGLLIPRMTQVERLAINTPLPGLLVYCTNSDSNGAEGMYMYKSSGWVNVL